MANNKINLEGAMLFEQPFARVPYENYRKVFRTSQKHIERELSAVQSAAKELSAVGKAKGSSVTVTDRIAALKSVDGMIGKVESLKRKLSDLHENASVPTIAVMSERLKHLDALEKFQSKEEQGFERWADTRLDRWVVDWALRSGHMQTARTVATEKGIEKLVDIELFVEVQRVEEALRQHSCTEALAWCSENKSALRKAKSTLEFDLRLQEYIELARSRKTMDAKSYCTKYLNPWTDTHMKEILQATALLAFTPSTKLTVYKRLYNPSRWETLVSAFRLAVYQLNTLPTEPLLHLALYAGLAALKLPACYDHTQRNPDCPVCDPEGLGYLAKEVPWSHHLNSTIVCRLSGKIMNEDNPPMAFPNGFVYSKEALEEMASKSPDGKVKCPRSGEECELSALRKVFIS